MSNAPTVTQLLEEFDRLGIGRQVDFDKLHLYSIITHSTAIEGSTLTLEENIVMFDQGIAPAGKQVIEQMMNLDLKRAYDAMLEIVRAKTPLSMALLKALAALVMRNTGASYHTLNGNYDEAKGDLRRINVSAGKGGASYLDWEKVELRTGQFVDWLNEVLGNIEHMPADDVYRLSYEAHFRLVTIHPWSDGNGRMARLLMDLVQAAGNVVPIYVRDASKAAYLASLRESQETGTSSKFHEFMAQETRDILSQMIAKYRRDTQKDVPWTDAPADLAPQVTPQVTLLLEALGDASLGARELRGALGLSDAKSFRERYLRPCLDAGYIQMTIPNKPNSRNQRYQATALGKALVGKGTGDANE